MRPRQDGQAGFTLSEVLIALALLAVIASLLVNAIASGQNLTLKSRRSGGDAIDRTSGSGPEVNGENRR